MDDRIVATLVGLVVTASGLLLLRNNVRGWRLQKNDPALDANERTYLYKRYRRRMQTSATVAVLGLSIPVGVLFTAMWRNPAWSGMYWTGVILVTFWVIVQAVGDAVLTTVHSRAALARVRAKQRELAAQVDALKNRRSNGQSSSDGPETSRQTTQR